jgi:hypothetical protein
VVKEGSVHFAWQGSLEEDYAIFFTIEDFGQKYKARVVRGHPLARGKKVPSLGSRVT